MKKSIKFLLSILSLVTATSLVGCGTKDGDKPVKGDKNWVDYANNGSVQLKLDYKDKDFFTDGVGEVTLWSKIDGDTAHFTPVVKTTSSETIKARFYGIDTPESTGKVEEYGKEASNYTGEQLDLAAKNGTIVVSSSTAITSYCAPAHDSTGSRYLSLVWINTEKKNASYNELTLLNLMIVQEGFSWVKSVDAIPDYKETFYAAQAQAEKYKLNLFSGEKAGYFNYGGYEEASLLDIKREIAASIADSSHENAYNNKKVTFTGVVSGFADSTLYVQEYYPVDENDPSKGGEYAGINIFVGTMGIPTKFTQINAYIRVYGLAQDSETFGFQLTDTQGHWPRFATGDIGDCEVLLSPDKNVEEHCLYTFQYTPEQLNKVVNDGNLECLFCRVEVTQQVKVKYFYINDAGTDITLTLDGLGWKIYIPFIYKGNPNDTLEVWKSEEKFVDHYFTIKGTYAYHKTTSGKINFQIIPSK